MKNGRHSLFLLELVLDLLIFSVCAAVCAGLLVYARMLSRDSATLADAVFYAQTAAETWRAGGEPEAGENGFTIAVTPAENGAGPETARIAVSRDGKEVFVIEEVARP